MGVVGMGNCLLRRRRTEPWNVARRLRQSRRSCCARGATGRGDDPDQCRERYRDNLWLWRADHYDGGETTGGQWPCNNALVVNGDDVTMYGLAAEHTLNDIVVWNGERGSTFFSRPSFLTM